MIQPGMMFGGEGPVMQGTWYNPKTGDAFTVRDSFFEDNQYVVTTTDGRYLRYDQIQSYIQTEMKLDELKQMKSENIIKQDEQLPAEVSELISTNDEYSNDSMMLEEDIALINNTHTPVKLGNIYEPLATVTPKSNFIQDDTPVDMNNAIIEKALKNTVKPDFSINVKWTDYPVKEIEMLKDIMDIPTEEIVEWYLNNIQLEDFVMAFKNAIDDKIRFGNQAEYIEAKVIRLPEVIDTYTVEDVDKPTKSDKEKPTKSDKTTKTVKKQSKITKK